jgi:uncharacterized protein YndB with AHSA1/START domain
MDIEQTITVDASPEAAFRALTHAEELTRWFASSAESDPRTGGEYVLRFEFEDDSRNHTYSGRYEDVTSNEHVRYPWNGQFGETTVDFVLRPADGGTEITLAHSGWAERAQETRGMHDQGWAMFLDNLKGYLEGAEDKRPAVLEMKTATSGASRAAGP